MATGLIVALASTAAHGAGERLSIRRLTTVEGLSHDSVNALAQDQVGFLWIATTHGLNRYDGHEMLVFRHRPEDENTIASTPWSIIAPSSTRPLAMLLR